MDIRFWLSALILTFAASAQAKTDGGNFYMGSGAGLYYVDFDGVDFDQSAATVRLFGGYKLNEYVSFEGGFTNLFEVSGDILGADAKMDGHSFDLAVRPTLPIGERFEAFGVLGYSWYDWKVKTNVNGTTTSFSDTDGEFLYGLGGAWHINDAWSLRGEWTIIDVSNADFGMVSASVSYNFR